MKKFLLLSFLIFIPFLVEGQNYRSTLGIRFANGPYRSLGITNQTRLAKKATLETIFESDFSDNHLLHLIAEKHHSILTKGLNYYFGAGMSFGSEESTYKDNVTKEKITTYGNATVGVDVLLGVELTLLKLNISWDVKPNFNLVGRSSWVQFQTGISIRTVIAKKKKKWHLFKRK